MKLSKEELLTKINDVVLDEDVKIELLEDITDSFETEIAEDNSEELEKARAKIEELEGKYKNLQEKYKERFLKGEEIAKEEEEKSDEGLEEKKVIDIKEI